MKLIIAQGGGHISMESENPLLYTLDSINHSENIITFRHLYRIFKPQIVN